MEIIENKNFEKIYKKEFQEFINNNISNIYHEIILTGPSTGNRNFVITENEKLIAIVPLNFEKKK